MLLGHTHTHTHTLTHMHTHTLSHTHIQAERLHLSGQVKPREMVRLNAIQRLQPVPPCIEPYCTDTDSVDVASLSSIVISTCVSAGTVGIIM